MLDRLYDRNEHIRHPCDQHGQRYDTHRIVSTAAAVAWLPHAKPRTTRTTTGKGNQSST